MNYGSHKAGAAGGTIVSDADKLSGSWVSGETGGTIVFEKAYVVYAHGEWDTPAHNIPFSSLYPSGGIRAVLKNGVFTWTLPNRPPAAAYLRTGDDLFPGTEGTFTGQLCWVKNFKNNEWEIFWDYGAGTEYQTTVSGYLIYATEAGTVTGSYDVPHPYDPDSAQYTEHFNLDLKQGWNTVIRWNWKTGTKIGIDFRNLSVETIKPPAHLKWMLWELW